MILPRDILSIILSYLPNIDTLKMEELNCDYAEEIWSINRKVFSNAVIKLLSKFFDDPEQFLKILKSSNALIYGSFVLAAIDNEIPYHDIDICVSEGNKMNLIKFFSEISSCSILSDNIDGFVSIYRHRYSITERWDDINAIYKFTIHPIYFHLVVLNSEISPQKFVANADFHCCKNTFDGKNVFIPFPRAIISRIITIDPLYYIHPIFFYYRMAKYIEKGYKFYIINTIQMNKFNYLAGGRFIKMALWLLKNGYIENVLDRNDFTAFKVNISKFSGVVICSL